MFLIRPIKPDDIDALMELLKDSGHGLTSLPKDKTVLEAKINHSMISFKHRAEGPNGESYLFAMEEVYTGKLVGVSGVISKIGGFDPYYFYRLKTEKRHSPMLNIHKTIRSMHIEKIHSGPAEICSLYLAPGYRNSQNGRFLSLSRFLFMAENRPYFENTIIAEMRGKVNADGHSPFWNAVGKKFMDIEFLEADKLYLKSKKFIEELLPSYPILIDLLPHQAQEVIAEVHENTRPARHILEKEGFKFNGLVGIFEPGPVLEAKLESVRAYKDSKVAVIENISEESFDGETQIISSVGQGDEFRACLGKIYVDKNQKATISAVTATTLKLKVNDKLRYVKFKA